MNYASLTVMTANGYVTANEYVLSFIGASIVGILCGITFAFIEGDRGPKRIKTIAAGIAAATGGWLFSLFLPLGEYQIPGAIGLSLILGIHGSFAYWAIIKKGQSRLVNIVEHNPQGNPEQPSVV